MFQDPDHSESCTTSCQHCLRHYGNRMNHQSLDWRLALDMVEMLSGRSKPFNLTTPWWQHYCHFTLPMRLRQLTGATWSRMATAEGDCFTSSRGQAILPIH